LLKSKNFFPLITIQLQLIILDNNYVNLRFRGSKRRR